MNLFILGIDGLEYELVKEWDLTNIMQLQYNKICVPINNATGVPMSPEVWASFLTGKHIKINFSTSSHFKPILDVMNFLNIDIYSGFGKKMKNFAKKLGFKFNPRLSGLKEQTFLDLTNSREINAPYYSFDHTTIDTLYLFGDGKISLKETKKILNSIYVTRKKYIYEKLNDVDNKDIVFAFLHVIDSIQHINLNHLDEIKKYYFDLDDYVKFLKNRLYDNFNEPLIIIVSDHGFDINTKDHSKYAFYSSDHKLSPKPKNITDFYSIIKNYG
jgi:hypothetical protein